MFGKHIVSILFRVYLGYFCFINAGALGLLFFAIANLIYEKLLPRAGFLGSVIIAINIGIIGYWIAVFSLGTSLGTYFGQFPTRFI